MGETLPPPVLEYGQCVVCTHPTGVHTYFKAIYIAKTVKNRPKKEYFSAVSPPDYLLQSLHISAIDI